MIDVCATMEGVLVEFDGFEVDIDRYELRQHGEPIDLEPQVFEVLAYLVANSGRVVPKTELLDEVWGSRFVSESALTTRIKTVRRALGDDGRTQRYVRTVHGRGYRFVGTVTTTDGSDTVGDEQPSERGTTGNLPAERTPLFGRDADVEMVRTALSGHRIVSLLGMGGTGKTRLAVAAARDPDEPFTGGAWFVDLVPADTLGGAELALAEVFGVGGGGDVRSRLTETLRDRRVLVVVDNAEHVVDAVADVLDHLLEHTVGPAFLVTSRVPLGLPDERRLSVPPLPTAEDGHLSPAVDLLVSAAARFGADVAHADPDVLRRICRSLDGLPLAIELAAAQLRHLDPAALAARLDRRFELLERETTIGPDRHTSLHAVLDDTWRALEPDDRLLLEQLGRYPGTFTLDDLCAVAEVGGAASVRAAERGLGNLVDRSLVVREGAGPSRYRLLETVKLFTRQQSGDDRRREVADVHAEWCLASVGRDPRRFLFDFDVAEWCTAHHADLRVAGDHLRATGRVDDAAMLVGASALAMHIDAGARAANTLERIERDLTAVHDDGLLTILHLTGVMCGMATRSPADIARHGAAAEGTARRTGDPVLVNAALVLRSWSTIFDDPELALEQTSEASDLAVDADEPLGRDFADGYHAFHLAVLRRYDEAEALARAVVARAPHDERASYPTYVGATALSTLLCIDAPAEALQYCDGPLGPPSERVSMWASDLVEAAARASAGDAPAAAAITSTVLTRLEWAGQEPWPDLLIPPIAHAVRIGDRQRAAGWLDATRAAGRPTQSFQATVLYRRLRDAVIGQRAALDQAVDVASIGRAALAWLADQPEVGSSAG